MTWPTTTRHQLLILRIRALRTAHKTIPLLLRQQNIENSAKQRWDWAEQCELRLEDASIVTRLNCGRIGIVEKLVAVYGNVAEFVCEVLQRLILLFWWLQQKHLPRMLWYRRSTAGDRMRRALERRDKRNVLERILPFWLQGFFSANSDQNKRHSLLQGNNFTLSLGDHNLSFRTCAIIFCQMHSCALRCIVLCLLPWMMTLEMRRTWSK